MDKDSPFMNQQLPILPHPTVTLFIEQVKKFRQNYAMLAEFAARKCGVAMKELTPLHLFMNTPEFEQWFREVSERYKEPQDHDHKELEKGE